MPNPPTLTPEQRQQALEKAAIARRQRAEVKEKLKMGGLNLTELFEQLDTPDPSSDMLAKLKVVSVLESLPGRRQGSCAPADGGARDLRRAGVCAASERTSGARSSTSSVRRKRSGRDECRTRR